MNLSAYSHCYGCGKDNPIGLRLKISYAGDKSHIEFVVKPEYCGYPGIMHGGVTGTLLDEVMFYAVAQTGLETVTTSMSIDYRSPALVDETLICEGWIEKREGKQIEVAARITVQGSGRVTATARGKFLEYSFEVLLARHQG